uniref:Uncharacterized protein n=1 Tax=Cajanus cajan TaxID=3821 RepID=A0A151QS31_CAJCA|nr:hypothetical protein KK1_046058 [Cajanus cajan]
MHGNDNPKPEPCQITKECREAYEVMHNFILCHATTVKLYREKYQVTQGGEIGLVISIENYVPYSFSQEDKNATKRMMDFFTGWILDPVVFGDYPNSMKELVKDRLPIFTEEEKTLVRGSIDFIGINYYRSFYARHEPNKSAIAGVDNFDALVVREVLNANGESLGYLENSTKSFVYPEGLYNVLIFLTNKYQTPKIYITENVYNKINTDNTAALKKLGINSYRFSINWSRILPEGLYNVLIFLTNKYQTPKIYITENGIASGVIKNPLKDRHRKDYIAAHLNNTKYAIDAAVNVQGYFIWSAFDSFEFHRGFADKWGLIYIDFNNNLNRVEKQSARWYRWFLMGNK